MRHIRTKLILMVLAVTLCLASCKNIGSKQDTVNDQSMELLYAKQFDIEPLDDGAKLITIAGKDRYLYVPKGCDIQDRQDEDITVIRGDLSDIYVASSSTMDLFLALNAMGMVGMTSTESDNWTIPEIRDAMDDGEIEYVGKYSMPDYEFIVDSGCDLVIENTMIEHTPEVREQFEALDIPVLTDYSSYEDHPLGRMEWIRLYGVLTGKEDLADEIFSKAVTRYKRIEEALPIGKKVAFFYITSSGLVSIRKPDDYVVQMIEAAGGTYAFKQFSDDDKSARPTSTIQMEVFYEMAADSDIIIYNGTIGGEIADINGLIEKCSPISEFKAVKDGNVWCTHADMFQQTAHTVDVAEDFYKVINDKSESDTMFMRRLE